MKSILSLLIIALLPSCTMATGNSQTGRYSFAGVGSDVQGLRQSATSLEASGVSGVAGFSDLNRSLRFALAVDAAASVARDLSAAWRSVKNTRTAAGVSKAASSEATKQAAISASVEKTAILNPVP